MSVRGIVEAFDKDVEIWTVNDIVVEAHKLGLKGSPTRVKKSFSKGLKAAGELYEVDTDQAVALIYSKLKEKFII